MAATSPNPKSEVPRLSPAMVSVTRLVSDVTASSWGVLTTTPASVWAVVSAPAFAPAQVTSR